MAARQFTRNIEKSPPDLSPRSFTVLAQVTETGLYFPILLTTRNRADGKGTRTTSKQIHTVALPATAFPDRI